MTLSAEELYRRGIDHGNAGRNAAARRALATARTRTDDPDLLGRIAGTESYLASRTGDPAGAERLCREALAAPGLTPATAAILRGQLGLLALHRGAFSEAVDLLGEAITGIGGDATYRAAMYLNRSVAQMQLGALDAARNDLARAEADFTSTGRDYDAAMAAHNLGYVHLLGGDLVAALQWMAQARVVLADSSPVNAAICDLDRAEVLRDAGLSTEAEQILELVARTFGTHGMRQARGEAEYNLARSLLVHNPARAATVAAAAARRFRALGSAAWAARATGVKLRAQLDAGFVSGSGDLIGAPGRPPSAEVVAQAASELDGLGFGSDATLLRLAHELWRARHGDPVTPDAMPSRNAPVQVRLLAHEVRVARAAAAGHDGEARRQAARGLDTLASWQRSFGSLDLQTSITMHGARLIYAGLAAALRSGDSRVVFEWSERARHLSQQVVPLRPPPDPALAADLSELRLLRMDDPGGDWLAQPRAAALRDRARERQWTSTGSAGLDAQVSLDELRAALDAQTAFVTYVFSGDAVVCLVVTDNDTRIIDLPAWPKIRATIAGLRADLAVSASVRSGPLAKVVAAALDERLAELAAHLVAAASRVFGDRQLVLTAPGALAGVPWTMLPGLRSRPLTVATSATRWVHDRGRPAVRGAGFAVGPGVARGEEEADAGAAAWATPTVLRGEQASVDAVTTLASGVDVLHVAAHGRHAADNPLFSGLELADGALFGYDIDRMPKVPQLVVLSACEVGRSSVRWHEEAIGMTRTWLHAGATCVVAAPVVVADDDACELLGAMHTGLAAGQAPAEALAEAAAATGVVAPFQCHGSGL